MPAGVLLSASFVYVPSIPEERVLWFSIAVVLTGCLSFLGWFTRALKGRAILAWRNALGDER